MLYSRSLSISVLRGCIQYVSITRKKAFLSSSSSSSLTPSPSPTTHNPSRSLSNPNQSTHHHHRFLSSSAPHHLLTPTSTRSQIHRIRFTSPPPPPDPSSSNTNKSSSPWKKPTGNGGFPNNARTKPPIDPRAKVMMLAILVGGVYYIAHLEKVPETDRWRFMNVNSEEEEKFSSILRQSIKSELAPRTLPPTHPISLHVHRIVSRILHASSLGTLTPPRPSPFSSLSAFNDTISSVFDTAAGVFPTQGLFETQTMAGVQKDVGVSDGNGGGVVKSMKWQVIVVDDPKMVNAMATPGLIVVFTGILPVCGDEEGLAAVLAHEMGHVVARHTAERLSNQTIAFSLLLILQFFGLNFGLSDTIQTLVMDLPNSRKQELEADLIGIRLMSRACYDPEGAPRMFEKLAKLESKHASKLEFFRTHPSGESRVKHLTSHLPEAYSILNSNPECAKLRDEYERFRRGVERGERGVGVRVWG